MPCSLMKTDCTALQLLCCGKLLFWISARNSYPFPETGRCILKQTITGRWMPLIQHMHSGAARMAKQTCRLRASSRNVPAAVFTALFIQKPRIFLHSQIPFSCHRTCRMPGFLSIPKKPSAFMTGAGWNPRINMLSILAEILAGLIFIQKKAVRQTERF